MLAECATWVDEGYKEGPNNETPFGRWYGDDNEPWCDQFISYCAWASGNADVFGKFEYCPSDVDFFKSKNEWGDTPQVGALVFYSWSENGVADHVGIVVSFDDSTITTYEGNTTDGSGDQSNGGGAYQRTRPRNGQILGYGYPAYSQDAPTPPPVVSTPWPGVTLRFNPNAYSLYVKEFQQRMIDRGWSGIGAADGLFGPKTLTVVLQFQREKGLTCDGAVGPQTWTAAFRTDNVT
jgi:hypothetical protein